MLLGNLFLCLETGDWAVLISFKYVCVYLIYAKVFLRVGKPFPVG